jgi:hypothetical protein
MLWLWFDPIASPDFWESEFPEVERSGEFEPAAAFEDFDELKADSFKLVVEPIAELARDAASRSNFELCGRALQIIREPHWLGKIVSAVEEDVLGPHEDAFNRLSKEISKDCWSGIERDGNSANPNKKASSIALKRWKGELKPQYDEFIAMAGVGSVPYFRLTEDCARFLASIGNALTWADWWVKAEELLTEARDLLTTDSPYREGIESSLRTVAEPAARQRLARQSQIEQRSQRGSSAKKTTDQSRIERRNSVNSGPTLEVGSNQTNDKDLTLIQAARNLAGFCELCSSIQSRCWEPFAASCASPQTQRLAVVVVHKEYRAKVSPWLELIVASYCGDTNVLQRVQNAAAASLSSLARAFLLVNDLDNAHRLAAEALALVFDLESLEKDIKDCLHRIASEQRRRTPLNGVGNGVKNDGAGSEARIERGAIGITVGLVALLVVLIVAGGISRAKKYPVHRSSEGGASVTMPPATDFSDAAKYGVAFSVKEPKDPIYQIVEAAPSARPHARPNSGADPVVPPPPAGFTVESDTSAPPAAFTLERVQPVSQRRQPVSLPNGMNLSEPVDANGLGRVTISNHNNQDAVVKLKTTSSPTRTVRLVYVQAMSNLTISKIPSGEYLLQFSLGRDWDSVRHAFRENQTFSEFGKPLLFSEDRIDENRTEYSTYKITLHSVPNGNIRRKVITAAEFADGVVQGGN